MKIFIKHMVSSRCKMVVRDELKKLGLTPIEVDLGEAEVAEDITDKQLSLLKAVLLETGLELMDNKKAVLTEKIKTTITEMIHNSEELPNMNFSDYISIKMNYNYTYLANLFSEVQGITIEQFIICHKIERIKELILYGELNITQIAWKMNYSSVAHLSNQFKKITGFAPTRFKQLKDKKRKPIEDIGPIIIKNSSSNKMPALHRGL